MVIIVVITINSKKVKFATTIAIGNHWIDECAWLVCLPISYIYVTLRSIHSFLPFSLAVYIYIYHFPTLTKLRVLHQHFINSIYIYISILNYIYPHTWPAGQLRAHCSERQSYRKLFDLIIRTLFVRHSFHYIKL